jgi:hypothetical protein
MEYGNGRLDAIQISDPMTLADDAMPCLALQWSAMPVRSEKQTVQRHNATVAIDADGASSKLKVTLTVERRNFAGTDLADITYVISAGAAKVAWDDTDFTASRTASAAVLKDVIDLINDLPGFKAWALHAPHSQSVNSDNFIDLAATGIKSNVGVDGRSEILYRDVSEDVNAYLRIGLPEERDRDAIELHEIIATATGVTNGTLKVYRDDYDEYGQTAEVYVSETLAAARTAYLGYDKTTAPVLRGPLLVHATSDDLTAIELRAHIKQAQLGL